MYAQPKTEMMLMLQNVSPSGAPPRRTRSIWLPVIVNTRQPWYHINLVAANASQEKDDIQEAHIYTFR